MNKAFQIILPLALVTVAVGCATRGTVEGRIRADREQFDSYPPEVQENIRAQQVKPGYTEDMARMALGRPARVLTRVTDKAAEEIWVYTATRPRFGFGIGTGVGRGRTGIGTGVGVHTGSAQEVLRVVLRDGRVHAIERIGR